MRRLHILTAALLTTAAALTYGHGQTRRGPGRHEGVIRRDVISRDDKRETKKVPKSLELVEGLPEGAEGVELKDSVLKARPGYEFEKKDDKVLVMRVAGGGPGGGRVSVGGSWACVCNNDGPAESCTAMIVDNQIYCAAGGEKACTKKCVLSITMRDFSRGIMR